MKKIFILLLLISTILLTGCLPNINKNQEINNTVIATNTVDNLEIINSSNNKLQNNLIAATTSNSNKREIKRFYPDNNPINNNKEISSNNDPEKSFIITPELIAKMYLIEKYNPGICFGMPTSVPQTGIDYLINNNKVLANFIKQRYHLSSDLEVYNKLKQFQNVQLTMISSSKYKFQFMDGQCCTLTFYQGTIEVKGDKAVEIIENKETKNNPC